MPNPIVSQSTSSFVEPAPSYLQGGLVTFDRAPLMYNPPPVILDAAKLTLMDLDWRNGLPSCSLPPACRVGLAPPMLLHSSDYGREQGLRTVASSDASCHYERENLCTHSAGQ